jgi:hypothetical protein
MLGLARKLAGSRDPVVYLPAIDYAATSGDETRVLTSRQASMLCTLDSDISIDHVVGDEFSSTGEVFRVASVTLKEIE